MSDYWSGLIKKLKPYVPGEQSKTADLIKLNTNEHPLGPSPQVLAAIHSAANETLRLYPDPCSDALRVVIGRHHQVDPACVFVGNGSDEVLAHVFLGLLKQPWGPLRFPDISYSFYPVYCCLYEIQYETVPLDDAFCICPTDYINVARPAGGIILPNPNAPTGIALTRDQVVQIAKGNPQAVTVIDEAYVDFGAQSSVPLTQLMPNVLTVHTLSKSRSLAGLRIGYAIGSPELIDGLQRIKNSFNSYPIDRLAQAGAAAAMNDEAYFNHACSFVIEQRDNLTSALVARGFEVLPSKANFVFARHNRVPGVVVTAFLRDRKVLVRHFQQDRIADFVRITVGTVAQNMALLAALDDLPTLACRDWLAGRPQTGSSVAPPGKTL
jgi:histidinol-phosphate aminotransferase